MYPRPAPRSQSGAGPWFSTRFPLVIACPDARLCPDLALHASGAVTIQRLAIAPPLGLHWLRGCAHRIGRVFSTRLYGTLGTVLSGNRGNSSSHQWSKALSKLEILIPLTYPHYDKLELFLDSQAFSEGRNGSAAGNRFFDLITLFSVHAIQKKYLVLC